MIRNKANYYNIQTFTYAVLGVYNLFVVKQTNIARIFSLLGF